MPKYDRDNQMAPSKMGIYRGSDVSDGSETFALSVFSTANVGPDIVLGVNPINQFDGSYRWRGVYEPKVGAVRWNTAIDAMEVFNGSKWMVQGSSAFEQMQTASESKQMPKVEDLPPVFKREIDL